MKYGVILTTELKTALRVDRSTLVDMLRVSSMHYEWEVYEKIGEVLKESCRANYTIEREYGQDWLFDRLIACYEETTERMS